jgi:signal transduction histidine kinase
MDEGRLRSWGPTFALELAFPVAALAAALLTFATTDISPGLVAALVVALIPWALVASEVRVGPWAMIVTGICVPGLVVAIYEAPGASFLALLGSAWVAASGESRAAEVVGVVISALVIPAVIASENWSEDREAFYFFATGGFITWCFGVMLRRERQLVAALTEAQGRLHEAAVAAERQRIARDVHDVVGHSLTVMLLNVAGARRVLAGDPDTAADALDRAEQAGRDSIQSVRAIVGLLGSPDDSGPEPPRPGAGDIADLVETAADAGLPVRAEVVGDLDAVDPYAGLAAYRLVQEALSNVDHHAPGSDVVVRAARDDDRLAVSVRNGPPRRPPARDHRDRGGTGIDGMRQRLGALGGSVTAGPDGDGWVVEGSIPLRRADAGADR